MLKEFLVNTDPAAGRAQESLLTLSGLNDPSLTLFVHVHIGSREARKRLESIPG